ncbi:hypothetical protein BN14_12198 [Rhizoctonia solani AG-1 IB]|uniref:Uncharacterized protein n=1 Tax=Thanatephorus cucumeris (strain AG1-IB / isolate 7/3/14) TaxID=1108050 RepID=M5CFF7_THACB|nr:hypothetical protein BN14_12198 [Rhizoctonia solani AG-1 IB]
MRDAPEHEVERGRLDAILAGDARFLKQEHIRLATAPAKVNFRDRKHEMYYNLMVDFCNNHLPIGLQHIRFYGYGAPPQEGLGIQIHPGVRYGSANHSRGFNSRYGYIDDRIPVVIQGIYESTVAVRDEQPVFPWNHWNNILGIGAWKYQEVHPINAVPATAFTSHFALSDIEMSYGHFWLTFSMITSTRPEDLMNGNEDDDQLLHF